MKKLTALLLVLVMALGMLAFPASAEEEEAFAFYEWNEDAPALKALIQYVEAVTDESSQDFIPVGDRIATFDMDGTLCAELFPTYMEYYMLLRRIFCDPTYEPDEEMLEFGAMLRDHALDKSFPDGMDLLHATHAMGLPFSYAWKAKRYEKVSTRVKEGNDLHMSNGAFELMTHVWHPEQFAEKIRAPFENLECLIPKKYDEVLTILFGPDYMTPPPVEERVAKHLDL